MPASTRREHSTTHRSEGQISLDRDHARDAIWYLAGECAGQLVLLRGKVPAWRGWKDKHPTAPTIIKSIEQYNYGVGIIPGTVRLAAVDVDGGDPTIIRDELRPACSLPTIRGEHLYYRDSAPYKHHDRTWRVGALHGDVRAGTSGLPAMIHGTDNLISLADAVHSLDNGYADEEGPIVEYEVVEGQLRPLDLSVSGREPVKHYSGGGSGQGRGGEATSLGISLDKPPAGSFSRYRYMKAQHGAIGGRISRRGPDPNSARSTRPWEAMGFGKTKYYALKKAGVIRGTE